MCTTRVICVIYCASCERLQDCADHLKRSKLVCTFWINSASLTWYL